MSFALLSNPGALVPNFNILAFDFSDPAWMGEIAVPTLLLWGADDGVSPPALGADAYDAVSTDPADKALIVYPRSAHSPHFEETDAVVADLRAFIEAHR